MKIIELECQGAERLKVSVVRLLGLRHSLKIEC